MHGNWKLNLLNKMVCENSKQNNQVYISFADEIIGMRYVQVNITKAKSLLLSYTRSFRLTVY